MTRQQLKQFGQKYDSKSDFDEGVNLVIREHIEQLPGDWEHQDFVETMQNWSEIVNEILYNGKLPTPLIGMRRLQKNRLADYLEGRNEFAINYQIRFNVLNIDEMPFWQQLVVLVHEMAHMWQHLEGEAPKSRTHNSEYLQKMADFGIICNKQGWTAEVRPGPFTEMLDLKGVKYDLSDPLPVRQTREPKVKWTCQCENFTISISEEEDGSSLHCTICDQDFAPREKRTGADNKTPAERQQEEDLDIELEDERDLTKMSKSDLKDILDGYGIEVKSRASKAVMIAAIEEYEANPTEETEKEEDLIPEEGVYNEAMLQSLKAANLRELAKARGLPSSGSKTKLIERILASQQNGTEEIDIDIGIENDRDPAAGTPDDSNKPDDIPGQAKAVFNTEKETWEFECTKTGCGKRLSRAAGVKTHWRKKHSATGPTAAPRGMDMTRSGQQYFSPY